MSHNLTRVKPGIARIAYSLHEVAEMFGVCTKTIQRGIERGDFPKPIYVGKRRMILANDLDACTARKKAESGR